MRWESRCRETISGRSNRCDTSVKYGIYDLFLCPSCENIRDAEQRVGSATASKEVAGKKAQHSKKSSKCTISLKDVDAVRNVGSTAAAASQSTPLLESKSTDGADGDDGVTPAATSASVSPEFVVNELLAYVGFYRNRSTDAALHQTVRAFYSPEDIAEAKRILVQKFQSSLGSSALLSDRRNSSSRTAHDAEIEDIIGIFIILDLNETLNRVTFVAVKLDSLPKFVPEELNVAAVVDRQVHTEAAVKDLSDTIQQLVASQAVAGTATVDSAAQHVIQSKVADMQQKLDSFASSVFARLDHLNTVCNGWLNSNSDHQQDRIVRQPEVADRKLNIVIFGVPEERDASLWRRKIDDILHFITDHSVEVVDMFRLGRYLPGKTRPVLVKLRTVWDKRLILSRCSKLKQ